MKDSLKLMQIYRQYLEITGGLIELLEAHCNKSENISDKLKEKYLEFRKHSNNLIEGMNTDLHKLIKIDYELKEIEELEKKEKK